MNIKGKIHELRGYSVAGPHLLSAPQKLEARLEIERLVGAALPGFYADFARDFCPLGVDAKVSGTAIPVSILLGYTTPSDPYDLRRVLDTFRGRIPDGTLPVALDDGGSLFLLDLESGAVSFFEHETEEVRALASSFEAFLQALEPQSDPDEE